MAVKAAAAAVDQDGGLWKVYIVGLGHIKLYFRMSVHMRTLCLLAMVTSSTCSVTRAERLERRRNSPAYKRAMSNIHLQFISEFLKEKPLTDPPVRQVWDFDPSGLGDESHFSLFWLLPGLVLCITAITPCVARGQGSRALYGNLPPQTTAPTAV